MFGHAKLAMRVLAPVLPFVDFCFTLFHVQVAPFRFQPPRRWFSANLLTDRRWLQQKVGSGALAVGYLDGPRPCGRCQFFKGIGK